MGQERAHTYPREAPEGLLKKTSLRLGVVA